MEFLAILILGVIGYYFYNGVDMIEAKHWFGLSAIQGFQLAIDELKLTD